MTETNNNLADKTTDDIFDNLLNNSERIKKGIAPKGYPTELVELYDKYEVTPLNVGKVVTATLIGESEEDFLFDSPVGFLYST